MKTQMQRLKYWLLALIIPVGCTTEKQAFNYFANHPSKFAKSCNQMFPLQLNTRIDSVPGPTIYVDCDSVMRSLNNTPITPADGVANALGNTTKQRAIVPVKCPPSVTKTIEVEKTDKLEAANVETERQRTRAENAENESARQTERANTNAKWLFRVVIILAGYVVLRLLKLFLSKNPALSWITKLIV